MCNSQPNLTHTNNTSFLHVIINNFLLDLLPKMHSLKFNMPLKEVIIYSFLSLFEYSVAGLTQRHSLTTIQIIHAYIWIIGGKDILWKHREDKQTPLNTI